MGTSILGMTEDQFWNSTLKKLFGLIKVHNKFKGYGQESEEDFIDNIF